MSLDPQVTGFALGLLLGAAKVGFIGSVGFGIAWWRSRRKVQRLEIALQDNAQQLAELIAEREEQALRQLERPRTDPGI